MTWWVGLLPKAATLPNLKAISLVKLERVVTLRLGASHVTTFPSLVYVGLLKVKFVKVVTWPQYQSYLCKLMTIVIVIVEI